MAESKIPYTDKFRVVTSTLASSDGWSNNIAYPTGFNNSNSQVVGFEVYANAWRNGYGLTSGTFYRTFISMDETGIRAYNNNPDLRGLSVRITLRKLQ